MIKTREQILNEAFIGKKPTDKLFSHWKDLTDFIKSHPHDPHLKEKCYLDFKKELSSLFGFDRTELVVIPTADINAMTLPIRFDDEDLQTLTDLFLVNDKMIKINPKYKNNTFFFFYSELILRLTAEESFAIFLHEVGHSFNNVLLQASYLSTRSRVQKMIDYVSGAINSVVSKISNTVKGALNAAKIYGDGSSAYNPYIEDYFEEVDRLLNSDKEYQKYKQWYGKMRDVADKQEKDVYKFGIINTIVHVMLSPILLPIGLITYMVGGNLGSQTEDRSKQIRSQWSQYSLNLENEYNADNFVSIFGYGKELSEAFLKFNDIYVNMRSTNSLETKVLRCVVLLNRMSVTSHPNEYARVTTLMKHADYELKNNKTITKEQRAELTKMLNGCKDVLDGLYKVNSDINKSPMSVRIYNRMNIKLKDKYEHDAAKRDYDRGYREIQDVQQGKKINEGAEMLVLNEKYFGTKPVETLYEYWTIIYNKLRSDEIVALSPTDPDYINFREEVCKVFGFGKFLLDIDNLGTLNAYTTGMNFSELDLFLDKGIFLVTNDGVKLNPKLDAHGYVCIYHHMFKLLECDELFAVFLHEIGHNFNDALVQVSCLHKRKALPAFHELCTMKHKLILSTIKKVLKGTTATQAVDIMQRITYYIWEAIGSSSIVNVVNKIKNMYTNIMYSDIGEDKRAGLLSYVRYLYDAPMALISTLKSLLNPNVWYSFAIQIPLTFSQDSTKYIKFFDKENQADNFASMYGFGPALSTGLAKFDKIIMKVNVGWGLLEGCQRLHHLISRFTMWCHPQTPNRLMNIQKHLEYELKNNKYIDKNQRKLLEENLAATRKAIEEYMDVTSEVGKMRPLTYKIYMQIQKRFMMKVYEEAANKRDFEFGYDYLQKEQEELKGVKECLLRENVETLYDLDKIYKE
jgi:hypothetical protein